MPPTKFSSRKVFTVWIQTPLSSQILWSGITKFCLSSEIIWVMIKLPSSSSLAGKSNKLNPKLSCFWSSCFRELFVFSWNEFCSSMVAPQNRDYQSWGLATYNFGDSPTTDPRSIILSHFKGSLFHQRAGFWRALHL